MIKRVISADNVMETGLLVSPALSGERAPTAGPLRHIFGETKTAPHIFVKNAFS